MSAICQALGNGRRCQQASSCTMLAQTSTGVIWAILKTFSHSLCRIILGTPKLTPCLHARRVFLARSKLGKPSREVLTRPYVSKGFAHAKRVITRPLLKCKGMFLERHISCHVTRVLDWNVKRRNHPQVLKPPDFLSGLDNLMDEVGRRESSRYA